MRFEWTINIGSVAEVLTIVVALYAMHMQNVRRLEKIEERLNIMFRWFEANVLGRK